MTWAATWVVPAIIAPTPLRLGPGAESAALTVIPAREAASLVTSASECLRLSLGWRLLLLALSLRLFDLLSNSSDADLRLWLFALSAGASGPLSSWVSAGSITEGCFLVWGSCLGAAIFAAPAPAGGGDSAAAPVVTTGGCSSCDNLAAAPASAGGCCPSFAEAAGVSAGLVSSL